MFNRKKEYKTTAKIRYAFIKSTAMQKLAECYVENDKHDRAVKAFIDYDILLKKAWGNVYELYPALKDKSLRHDHANKIVRIVENPS